MIIKKWSLGCLFVLAACGWSYAQHSKSPVMSLAWMSGCWENAGGRSTTTERWAKPTENLMIGTSQTVRGGKSVGYEFLRLADNGQGVSYIARPSSAKDETAFAAVKVTATEAIFENLKHDFPQRVIYRSEKPDALFARIEGMQNGELKGMDIPMKRIKCE